MSLQARIDDSKQPPIFVLAGFISSASEWKLFETDWKSELERPPRN